MARMTHTEPHQEPSSPVESTDSALSAGETSDPSLKFAELEAKHAEVADAYLRAKAEAENTRRRAEEDVSKARKFAVEAFAEKGFTATTTRDIAARAGMSPAAVYVHHDTKESLLFTVSVDGHRSALHVVESGDDPTATPVVLLVLIASARVVLRVVFTTASQMFLMPVVASMPPNNTYMHIRMPTRITATW